MTNSQTTSLSRAATWIALVTVILSAWAVLYMSRNNPSLFLRALFVLWVSAPPGLLLLLYSRRLGWLSLESTRHLVSGSGICLVSIAVYGLATWGVMKSKPAFWFVVMPVLSVFLILIMVLLSKRTGRGRVA